VFCTNSEDRVLRGAQDDKLDFDGFVGDDGGVELRTGFDTVVDADDRDKGGMRCYSPGSTVTRTKRLGSMRRIACWI